MERRNDTVDGLRGLAALSVLVFHVWLYGLGHPPLRESVADSILFEFRIGFVVFFVLSGFLVALPFMRAALGQSRPVASRGYLARRAARIVPGYWVALVGALVLMGTAGDAPGVRTVGFDRLPAFLLFIQNYFPSTVLRLDAPTWTLDVEVAFYLALAIGGMTILRRAGLRAQLILIAVMVALGLGWNLLSHQQEWGPVATHMPLVFMPYFALGMLVALATLTAPAPGRGLSFALACSGLALVVADGYWHATDRSQGALIETVRDLPAALGIAAMLAAIAWGTQTGLRWLAWRPLIWIGLVSYGMYLWHVPLIVWLNSQGMLPGGVVADLVTVLPLAILAGAASWYLLERRFTERAARLPRVRG